MKCPFCQHDNTNVLETRVQSEDNSIRRRRRCESCDARFTTLEYVKIDFPWIVKRDGRRESYQADKLRYSLMVAARKRPISAADVDAMLHHIQAQIRACPEKEIASKTLGAFTMEALRAYDWVAYIRFASVYQDVQNRDDFLKLIEG